MEKSFLIITLLSAALQLTAQDEIEVVNIENLAVQAYLADRTYEDPNTSTTASVIATYNSKTYGSDRDCPNGKVVDWTPTVSSSSIAEIDVRVSNHEDFSASTVFHPSSVSATSYTILNLLPDLNYYYKVEEVQQDGSVTVVASGEFRTAGQVRMMCLDGVVNVRDLGGWHTSFGVPVKYGKLYRSGKPDNVTTTGKQQFHDAGIGAQLDLRGGSLKSSSYGSDVDFENISNDKLYSGITSSSKQKIFVEDLQWIIGELKNGKPVNFHCMVGCDRTGTLAFLIEGLLGVSRNDIDRDFELSSFASDSNTSSKGGNDYYRTRNYSGVGNYPKMWTYLLETYPADNLAQTFYEYWKKIGMSDDELTYFRHEMLGSETPADKLEEVTSLQNYLLGKEGKAIDANNDGETNIADITHLIQLLLQKH